MPKEPQVRYDVVIIGGGPAGTVCAMRLRAKGVKGVLVLESGNYNKFVVGESLPPETSIALKKLGIYGEFLEETHEPSYGICSYWGDDRRGYNDTVLSPYGHGWHVDRRRFNEFLAEMAQKQGVHLLRNAQYKTFTKEDEGRYELEYTHKGSAKKVRTSFVIDATGNKRSFVLQKGSVPKHNTPLVCLGRRYRLPKASAVSSLTRIEAVEKGWWYGARLPNNEMLVGLYTTIELIKIHQLQKDTVWNEALVNTISIGEGLKDAETIDQKLIGFHAASCCLNQVVGTDWLAIGDAASSYDPITSRGVYKAITHAMLAADQLIKYHLGESQALRDFEVYVKTNYDKYLLERAHYYQIEQRWSNSNFWSLMHEKTQQGTTLLSSYS